MHSLIVASALAALLGVPRAAVAAGQAAAAPQEERPRQTPEQQDADARETLEEEIARELAGGGAKAPAAPSQAQAQPATGGQGTGGNPMARLLLLPDIGAIGRFAVAYDSYDVETLSPREGPFGPEDKPQPLFDEIELALQAVVDPYARADVFIAFTPEEVDVEEAYLTTLSLPAGFQLKAGQFFSPFGRQNPQHPHVWEFIDAPLARGRLLADESLSGPGLDVAWLAPLPWFLELHLAGQATAPAEEDPQNLTGVARLLQYFALGDTTTLGVGVSAARRSEGTGMFRDMGGADAYVRWRPLQSRSYLTLQGELYTRRFVDVEGVDEGWEAGGYAQVFWRQSAYWGLGVRYDDAPAVPEAGSGAERRYGALVSWLPSEFQRLRLQVSYDRRPDGGDGVEALLGLEFGIGSHGAHPF